VGFVAMLLLLNAAAAVATAVNRMAIAQEARGASVLVVIAAAGYALIKLGATPRTVGTAVLLALVLLGLGVAVFVKVLRTVRTLADALRSVPPPELPAARTL
jgi:hypothetical protein